MAKRKDPNSIMLNNAYKIDRKGRAVNVPSIIAPESGDCCLLDCCTKSIKFIDDQGVKKDLPLDDLWALLNPE